VTETTAGTALAERPEPGRRRRPTRSWVLLAIMVAFNVGCVVALMTPMTREGVGLASIGLMLGLIFLRMPVAIAIFFAGLLGLWALRDWKLVESTLATITMSVVDDWTLSVIPMFVLMGFLLWKAGLTDKLFAAGKQWLGWLPGGLAVGTNVAGAGLAAVSGSSVGMTYALTRMSMPEMLKAGYHPRLAIGAIMVAGLPGQLIPPSIMLVIYAGIAEVPVGPQLVAGVLPGILVATMFTLLIVGLAIARPSLVGGRGRRLQDAAVPWSERFRSLGGTWPIPLVIAVIVVAMFSGVFTATEAGAAAAGLALIIAVVSMRKSRTRWAELRGAAVATVSSIGAIFFMLVGVAVLSRLLSLTGISNGFADFINHLQLDKVEFLIMMTVVYLILGTFMEPLPIMVLTVPILLPTLASLDISLLWFGVFAVFMGEIAILTPPVGILSFIIHTLLRDPSVSNGQKISIGEVFRSVLWFLPMALAVVAILIAFPDLATFLVPS
jgi:C4-dicarboxylate transporter, DctM subunit